MAERGESGLGEVRRSIWMSVVLALVITLSLFSFLQGRSGKPGVSKTKSAATPGTGPSSVTVSAKQFQFEQMRFRPGIRAGFDSTVTGILGLGLGLLEQPMRSRDAGEAIPQLIEALSHPSPAVRRSAAFALGRYRYLASEAVPMLKELQRDDPDLMVRAMAGEALYNIRLYDFGPRELSPAK